MVKSSVLCPVLLLVAAGIPHSASAQSFFGQNLLVNPGAEDGDAASASAPLARPIPGWIPTGNFTVESYGAPGGFPLLSDPGSPNRGAKFFSGGPDNTISGATQTIQVPSDAFQAIDAGSVYFNLSAWLGGYDVQDDSAEVMLRFGDATGAFILNTGLEAVLAKDRPGTSFVKRTESGRVPAGTRMIQVSIVMRRHSSGPYNDGYADEPFADYHDRPVNDVYC